MPRPIPECVNRKCITEIIGPGWDAVCTASTTGYQLSNEYDYIAWTTAVEANESWTGGPLTQSTYSVNVTYEWSVDPWGLWNSTDLLLSTRMFNIRINTMRKSTPGVNGTLQMRECLLSEALIRYPVLIQNGSISLQDTSLYDNHTVQLILREEEDSGQLSKAL